jgi:hypothetical protein
MQVFDYLLELVSVKDAVSDDLLLYLMTAVALVLAACYGLCTHALCTCA